jgi:hypothetical protein
VVGTERLRPGRNDTDEKHIDTAPGAVGTEPRMPGRHGSTGPVDDVGTDRREVGHGDNTRAAEVVGTERFRPGRNDTDAVTTSVGAERRKPGRNGTLDTASSNDGEMGGGATTPVLTQFWDAALLRRGMRRQG